MKPCRISLGRFFPDNFAKRVCLAVTVLAAASISGLSAQVMAGEAETAFEELAEQYRAQREKYLDAWSRAETKEEWARVDRELNPANVLLDQFLELEKTHRKSRIGLSALRHILAETKARRDREPPAEQIETRRLALEILKEHYFTDPDLDFVISILDSRSKLPEELALLKAALEHPERRVRATALWERAMQRASESKHLVAMDSGIELLSTNARKHKEEIERWTRVREYYRDVDPEASRQEALKLFKRIADDYADVLRLPRVSRSPVLLPAKRERVDPLTKKPRRSLGEMAGPIQFDLTHLAPGCEPPEISGPDVFGKERSLHNQRGKVVVLMFSFTGCGPCERMYPDNRDLIKKYEDRPFAFLGIMGDEKIETVKHSIDQGHITWPVWWDGGIDGPISSRWNVPGGWPETYVIDHKGVIRYRGLRDDALAFAVEKLVAEAENASR